MASTEDYDYIVSLNDIVLTTELAGRNLNLLKTIEITLDHLNKISQGLKACEKLIIEQANNVKHIDHVIDNDDNLVSILEATRDLFAQWHGVLNTRCESARNDPDLAEDDGIVEAYCELIDFVARVHNAVNALAWAVGEHDADFDVPVPGGPYKSADDLFVAMGL